MAFFSIVIPVHNVEKYLDDCVQSVLAQTYTDYEVILVDDGSTDESSNICDQYAKKNDCNTGEVNVIHKENGGAPSARNAGIKAAKGDFLVFLDSDDYFADSNFLEDAYHVLCKEETVKKEIDLLFYGMIKLWGDGENVITERRYEGLEKINYFDDSAATLEWMAKNDKFIISVWMQMVRRSFIVENKLYFDEALKTAEDIEWTFRIMSKEPGIYGMNILPYMHRVRENSLCTDERKTGFCKYRFQAVSQSFQHILSCNAGQKYKDALYAGLAYHYYVLLAEIPDEPDPKIRKEAFEEAEKLKILQRYSWGRKEKACRMIIGLLGIKRGARILNFRVCYQRKHIVRL